MMEKQKVTAEEILEFRKWRSFSLSNFAKEQILQAMEEYASLLLKEKDEEIERLKCILQESAIQLQYLNGKFQETGTTNSVISKIEIVLKQQNQ